MNRENIKAIIFDMDGVIVDSEPIHEKSERETFLEFGMNVPSSEWDNFRGRKQKDILSYVVETYGTGKESLPKMVERIEEMYIFCAMTEMTLIPGVLDFLRQIKEDGRYKTVIATSGARAQQEKILRHFDVAGFFGGMITAEDVQNGKPHPEPYMKATSLAGISPAQCLVVEDSDNGILSARSAGCLACGLIGTFSAERLESAGSDFVVRDYTKLAKIIF